LIEHTASPLALGTGIHRYAGGLIATN